MTQTWDFTYYTSLIAVTGAGDTLSEGVGSSLEHGEWPFTYADLTVPATGAGNTDSTGVGSVGTPQIWPFDYWDGVTRSFGDTLSEGVGSVSVLGPAAWYSIDGLVVGGVVVVTGAGDTLSEGVGAAGIVDSVVSVTGVGDTLSEGVAPNPLPTVVPPGTIRLSPYWVPGEIVYVYLLHEWLGSYEARLGAGPGPWVQLAYGDPDTTVAFGGLGPGQYVAVAGRKRVHFMVTP